MNFFRTILCALIVLAIGMFCSWALMQFDHSLFELGLPAALALGFVVMLLIPAPFVFCGVISFIMCLYALDHDRGCADWWLE